jgi:REP element-mobilizing transposase RayT
MPHTYISCDIHCIFATKERAPLLTPEIQGRLFPYFGGIAQQNRLGLFAVGGIEDHVHLLFSIPTTISISAAVKLFKGSSSRWIHQTFPYMEQFAWQEGYGAFGVSRSLRENTIKYINTQIEHHRQITSAEEFRILLQKHGINYCCSTF